MTAAKIWYLSLHFSGKIKSKTVNKLIGRLDSRSGLSLNSVKINITPLADFNENTFEKFIETLSDKCETVRIYCVESQKKKIEFFNRIVLKYNCSVSYY